MSSIKIFGAEKARREARKRLHEPRPSFDRSKRRPRSRSNTRPYPRSMREYERFFGCLMSSSIQAIRQSETDVDIYKQVMHQACTLLNVPTVAAPYHLLPTGSGSKSFQGTYENARSYYMSRAPLVLEESRCIVADVLSKSSRMESFELNLISVEEKYPKLADTAYAPVLLHFDARGRQLDSKSTRPGGVFLIKRGKSSVLACVATNGSFNQSATSSLLLMIFRRNEIDLAKSIGDPSELIFHATPLTTLISHVRQIEACLRMVKVPFLQKLLGVKGSTHIRFDNSEDSDQDGVVDDFHEQHRPIQEGYYIEEESIEEDKDVDDEADDMLAGLLSKLSNLNATQELAARKFLDSPKESLHLVQGPPGTGKSTFLVNVICRRLATNPKGRILVTAPTNRAVLVLAERFLAVASNGDMDLSTKCNAVLVGVEDKLISSSDERCIPSESSLRSIYAYTWLDTVKIHCTMIISLLEDYMKTTSGSMIDRIKALASKLSDRLNLGLPSARNAGRCALEVLGHLDSASAAVSMKNTSTPHGEFNSIARMEADRALKSTKDLAEALDGIDCPVAELLATARVVFCTLSTAGSSILKQTKRFDDLLVDEAAAATEPELCIPFHLRPQRLLAVGDPAQLPPTIMSRHAADLGLSITLHERLMNLVGCEYIMLDQQYRMVPEISAFPCKEFYNGEIQDGDNVLRDSYKSDLYFSFEAPYQFIHVTGVESQQFGGSYENEEECKKVVSLVQQIKRRSGTSNWQSADKLRIITFYQGQVTLLKRMLSKKGLGRVFVGTVDSNQGCEADITIVSFVRSSAKRGARHATGFLTDTRRINVALTRARHHLVCVGNSNLLAKEGSDAVRNLISHSMEFGCLRVSD